MGELEELATSLIEREGRGETPFGFYIIRSNDPAAELGRAVEREVFLEFFGNTPDMLHDEYDPYEGNSLFLVLVDHLRLVRRAGHVQLLRQVGRPERHRVDALHPDDLVDVAERLGRLEHRRDVDLLVQVRPTGRRGARSMAASTSGRPAAIKSGWTWTPTAARARSRSASR